MPRANVCSAALAVALFLAAAPPAGAQPLAPAPIATRLANALAVAHVARSASGALAIDLATGKPLYAHNPALSLAPASNEKLAVTYAALVVLGPSFRTHTDVLGEGVQDGALWRGDLVIQGHGDPSLSSDDVLELARAVRGLGIGRITGSVVGDESYFDGRRTVDGWKGSFYIDESPPLSALTVDRDVVHGVVWREPALAAATALTDALRRSGVGVAGNPVLGRADDAASPLTSVASPPLSALLTWMDHESDNFVAETLLKQLGAVDAGVGTSAAGAAVVMRELGAAGVPLAGVRIVDGSGLSRLDRLTPNALVAILLAAWNAPDLRGPFLAALPVAGVSGTLEHRMRKPPALGNVLAKTGTTAQASALSGYVRDRYVFSVLENGHPISAWWARKAQDRFATVLASEAVSE